MIQNRVCLRDIAREIGVSHVTVSLAMRGHPRISEQRRREVLAVAERLGYRPDPALTSLIAYREHRRSAPVSNALAWINRWPEPRQLRGYKEFDGYWQGARDAAESQGFHLEEFIVGPAMSAGRLQQMLLARGIRGILLPPHQVNVRWDDFAFDWSRFAVVRFGFSIPALPAHMIGNDQMRSGELAVARIAERGYHRIGFIDAAEADRATDGNFRVGFIRGLESVGQAVTIPPLVVPGRVEENARLVAAWIRRWKPDAILTTEPRLALLLRNLGFEVPRDIGLAVTSVRDGEMIDAGIDQGAPEIGRVAVNVLAGLIHRWEPGFPAYPRRVLVEGRWSDGSSLPWRTARPSAEASESNLACA